MDNSDICDKVVTIPQYSGTCWFNAILMAILYSQNSRKLLLYNNIYKNNKINKLYEIINEILTKKYISVEKAISYYHIMRPENILGNIIINKIFLNKIINKGYYPSIFLSIFITYLGKTCISLDSTYDYKMYNINLMKSIGNISFDLSSHLFNKNIKKTYIKSIINHITNIETNPDYIIINKFNNASLKDNNIIEDNIISILPNNIKYKKYKLNKLDNTIIYNGIEYVLDSCILSNFNEYVNPNTKKKAAHAIAGITCKNKRYVYNGWIRTTLDANIIKDKSLAQFKSKPCELMKFDWDINKENMFCLNPSLCKLDNINITDINKLCFSFDKGNRTLIYVKKNENYKSIDKDISTNDKSSTDDYKSIIDDDKKCPDGKILNPKTGRCIKIESFNKLYKKPIIDDTIKKPIIDDDKKCPDGKILNPKTKRCIKIESFNKLYNKPIIDDTIKKPIIQNDKKCPDGKILNPKTGRCIKIESYKKMIN